MKSLFEDITENEYKTLEKILQNPNSEPVDFFFDDPTIDGQVQILSEHGLITDDAGILNITELGRAALVWYESYQNKIQPLYSEIDALNQIANALKQQTQLAREQAVGASNDARFSKATAVIAIIISITSTIVQIVSG